MAIFLFLEIDRRRKQIWAVLVQLPIGAPFEKEKSSNAALIQEIKLVIEVLNKRDESIQFLMKIMDEKFEKVWGIPWELAQMIHSFTWNKEDVRDISSKVSSLPCI